MHSRTELYDEDTNTGSKLKGIGRGWLPFSDGPRVCLGKDMVLIGASPGLLRIIQAFPSLKLPPGQIMGEPGTESIRWHLL